MAAYDAWGGSWGTSWALSWTGEHTPTPEPEPEAPTQQPAGRRTRRKIVLRLNGELQEVESLDQVLEVLKAVKKDIPATAKSAAAEYVGVGKRIGEAKKEQAQAIEVVDAPYSVRDMIQTRVDEIQRLFWRRVAAHMKLLAEEDEELLMML